MCADFNFYLNRQGIRGPQGLKGDKGDDGKTPVPRTGTDTPIETTVIFDTGDGNSYETPNLKYPIEDRGGNTVMLDRVNETQYYGTPDQAMDNSYGVVKLATPESVLDDPLDNDVVTYKLFEDTVENLNETLENKANIEDIPTVGNGTITIKQGNSIKGTFTTNQTNNSTIELDVSSGGGGSGTYTEGNGINISNNVINVKVDGNTIDFDSNGNLSANVPDVSNYYTKSQTDNLLYNKIDNNIVQYPLQYLPDTTNNLTYQNVNTSTMIGSGKGISVSSDGYYNSILVGEEYFYSDFVNYTGSKADLISNSSLTWFEAELANGFNFSCKKCIDSTYTFSYILGHYENSIFMPDAIFGNNFSYLATYLYIVSTNTCYHPADATGYGSLDSYSYYLSGTTLTASTNGDNGSKGAVTVTQTDANILNAVTHIRVYVNNCLDISTIALSDIKVINPTFATPVTDGDNTVRQYRFDVGVNIFNAHPESLSLKYDSTTLGINANNELTVIGGGGGGGTTYTAGIGINITNNVISIDSSTYSTIGSAVQPNDLGTLAYKNSVDYTTDITNKPTLGDLAGKDTVDYDTEVTNKPTIGAGIITFTQGTTTLGTIDVNQTTPTTINIPSSGGGGGGSTYAAGNGIDISAADVISVKIDNSTIGFTAGGELELTATIPTDTSDLTNNAGYITSSALNGYATETWVGNQGYLTSISSGDIITALGYTPYPVSNPNGYITEITSSDVITALGYTPYSNANPNGYTSNVGTVTSVNNINPDSAGDITLSIPSDTNDLTNGAGYITGITSSDVTSALGYTPYNSSNPDGYTSNVGTVTSVNNNSPDSNGNVSINIPTVNDSTISFTVNGISIGSITTNQSSGSTIALTDTQYSDMTGATSSTDGTAGLVPQPLIGDEDKFLRGDGTWQQVSGGGTTYTAGQGISANQLAYGIIDVVPDGYTLAFNNSDQLTVVTSNLGIPEYTSDLINNSGFITGITSSDVITALGYTPYNPADMTGAGASTAGIHGLVPAPAAGDNGKFLRGDGTWQTVHDPAAYLVELSPANILPSWYRVWSDGWCEQGGIMTCAANNSGTQVNLTKTYDSSNYTTVATIIYPNGISNFWSNTICTGAQSASSFRLYIGSVQSQHPGNEQACWMTAGFLAIN